MLVILIRRHKATGVRLTHNLHVRTCPVRVRLRKGREFAFHAIHLGADLERGAVDSLLGNRHELAKKKKEKKARRNSRGCSPRTC